VRVERRLVTDRRRCARRWRTEPFGVDPVFRRGGSLYDAGARTRLGDYYNTSLGSAVFNALGNPLGFSPASACVTGDHSTFVAVVDASVTAARADQLARLLIEGGFLHRQLYSVSVKTVTFNADQSLWAVRTLFAQKQRGGSLRVGRESRVLRAAQLRADSPLRYLEALCLVYLLLTTAEHGLAVKAIVRRWRPRVDADGVDLVGTLESLATLDTDVRRKGEVDQVLQLSGKLALLAANALYITMLYLNLTLEMPVSVRVYDQLFAAARFLLTARREAGTVASSPCGVDVPDPAWDPAAPPPPRWALADDERGLQSLLGAIGRLERLERLERFWGLCAAMVRAESERERVTRDNASGESTAQCNLETKTIDGGADPAPNLDGAGHRAIRRRAAAAHGLRQSTHAVRGGHAAYRSHRFGAGRGPHPSERLPASRPDEPGAATAGSKLTTEAAPRGTQQMHLLALVVPLGGMLALLGHVMLGEQVRACASVGGRESA